MGCWILHQAHLQKVGLFQFQLTTTIYKLVQPLDVSQGPSHLHDHNP